MYFLIIYCTCLLLFLNQVTASTIFDKRQAIASRSCGGENNTVAICSPTASSVWYNNTLYEITWKYNNPYFNAYNQVDLYLLYSPSSGQYESIKNWTGLDKSTGVFVPTVDDSWYPQPIKDNSPNVSWTMYFYLVGTGADIQEDLAKIPSGHNQFPPPQPFTLIQSAHNTTHSTSAAPTSSTTQSSPSTLSTSSNDSNQGSNRLPGWAIALICIVSILFIAASIALIWAVRRYKNRKHLAAVTGTGSEHANDEKLLVPDHIALTSAAAPTATHDLSVHSASPPQQNRTLSSTNEKLPAMQQASLGIHSEANHSSSILSSTDALMIADTFRQFMRKPEWNEDLELNEKKEEK
ncbi:unnamed protein product [Rhizopus microsporus]